MSLLEQSARANNKTWGNTGTTWGANSSWNPTAADSGDVAVFDSAAIIQPRLNAATTIQELNFSTTTSSGYDITSPGPSYTLTLTNTGTGTTSAINAANTSGTNTIDCPLVLGAASGSTQTFTQASGGTLIVNGLISNTNTVTLSLTGGGIIQLAGANTYSGGTTLASGATLRINSDTALGTGTFTINGGTIDNTTAGSINLSNNNAQAWNGNFTFSGTQNLNLGTGTVSLGTAAGTSRTITTNANTLTIGGVISNGTTANSLVKTGAGTLALTGANTYSDSTTISGGTLTAAASSGSALGSTSSITVNSGGTLLLGAGDQINNSATMTLAGGTFAKGSFSEGSASSVGMGALTLTASGSHIDFGSGTVGPVSFASFSPGAYTLTIDNWTGTANTVGSASTDRLIFDSDQSSNLSDFLFTGYSGAAEFALGGGYYEIVPLAVVPEPSTYVAGILTLSALAYSQRRRLCALLRLRH